MSQLSPVKVWLVGDISSACTVVGSALGLTAQATVAGRSYHLFDAETKAARLICDVMLVDQARVSADELAGFVSRVKPHVRVVALCADARSALAAADAGAADTLVAPPGAPGGPLPDKLIQELIDRLVKSVRQSKQLKPIEPKPYAPLTYDGLICIGASTGGTEATYKLLKELPAGMPPMLIVQHMPPAFTTMYAERLDKTTPHRVREAMDKDTVSRGEILLAPGDKHMRVARSEAGYRVECAGGDKVNGHRPSVDVLFNSAAQNGGKRMIAVILTGMGGDGAQGMLKMRKAGAYTFGQDESSCVVYGMPKVAKDMGAVCKEAPLAALPQAILSYMLGRTP